jgi:copper resistance protein D
MHRRHRLDFAFFERDDFRGWFSIRRTGFVNGDPIALAQIMVAALGDIAFAATLGAMLIDRWLRTDSSPARLAAVVLVLCNVASLWLLAMEMSGASFVDAGASLRLVVTATHAGTGWAVALAGSVILLLASQRAGVSPMLIGALIAAAGKSAIGHAADAGTFSIAEAVQMVHLLATGVWGGVVIAGAIHLPKTGAHFTRVLQNVSRTAMIAVAFVLATGLYNAIRGTGGALSVLTSSTWGHALDVKIVLVIAALAIGAWNRWIVMPRAAPRKVIHLMQIEALAIIGVFVAAAVLSHSMPGLR